MLVPPAGGSGGLCTGRVLAEGAGQGPGRADRVAPERTAGHAAARLRSARGRICRVCAGGRQGDGVGAAPPLRHGGEGRNHVGQVSVRSPLSWRRDGEHRQIPGQRDPGGPDRRPRRHSRRAAGPDGAHRDRSGRRGARNAAQRLEARPGRRSRLQRRACPILPGQVRPLGVRVLVQPAAEDAGEAGGDLRCPREVRLGESDGRRSAVRRRAQPDRQRGGDSRRQEQALGARTGARDGHPGDGSDAGRAAAANDCQPLCR